MLRIRCLPSHSHIVVDRSGHFIAWDCLPECLAVRSTDLSELISTFDLRWRDSINDRASNVFRLASDNQKWDVPERAHVSVLSARNVPAVVSEFPIASAELEGKHPAINHEAESLVVQSLNVAEDHKRQHSNVEDPDEESGAGFAKEPDSVEEDPVEDPVERSNGSEDAPEGESDDRDDTQLPNQ